MISTLFLHRSIGQKMSTFAKGDSDTDSAWSLPGSGITTNSSIRSIGISIGGIDASPEWEAMCFSTSSASFGRDEGRGDWK